jgi:hypothetical protein
MSKAKSLVRPGMSLLFYQSLASTEIIRCDQQLNPTPWPDGRPAIVMPRMTADSMQSFVQAICALFGFTFRETTDHYISDMLVFEIQ